MQMIYRVRLTLVTLYIVLSAACTTIPIDERAQIREEIEQSAADTIAQIVAEQPELQKAMDKSAGYLVGSMSATKVPIVGGGYGLALLYDRENGTRTYLNISRFDLGAGLGVGRYRALVIFKDSAALNRVRDGSWQRAFAAESSVGTRNGNVTTVVGEDYAIHIITDAGAALSATVRAVKISVNHDLTDSGVSEISIPNTGFSSTDDQGESAPRIWDHKLPFFAQKVIDEGYDLPLPYGIGVTYANVDQEQILTSLQVGINGSEIIPLDWVAFDNASSESESLSIKADAWIFPFMNVFAMVGKVDGVAPIDVLIDGNGFLDELGINCGSLPPSPLCALLEDQLITLPIRANFEGNTYGIGTTFAAGWNGWFVTLPFNWTYADMKGSMTDGVNFTATPRFGKVINLGRKGNLALFAGGNYLDSELTVDGLAGTPGDELVFDYIIDQENKDKWNALLGFNWDVNRRLSWSAEYDGFTGSRDAFITSVVWRY